MATSVSLLPVGGALLAVGLFTSACVKADDYAVLADALATPVFKSENDALLASENPVLMVRMELARQRLIDLTLEIPELADVHNSSMLSLTECKASLDELRRLDEYLPDVQGIASRVLRSGFLLLDDPDQETDTTKPDGDDELDPDQDPDKPKLTEEERAALIDLTTKVVFEVGKGVWNEFKASAERDNYTARYGKVRRGGLELAMFAEQRCTAPRQYLYGVGLDIESSAMPARITSVQPNSPAEAAGIQIGDEIVMVDGEDVSEATPQEAVINSLIDDFVEGIGKPADENSGGVSVDGAITQSLLSAAAGNDINVMRVRNALVGEADTSLALTTRRDGMLFEHTLTRSVKTLEIPQLTVDLDGSWDGVFSHDRLTLTNTSGRDLTDCTLVVDLTGEHGPDHKAASDRHLHFIRRWPAGESRVILYAAADNPNFNSNESVDLIKRMNIDVFANEIRNTMQYDYEGLEYDLDVDGYLKTDGLKPALSASYAGDNIFGDACVYVSLDDGAADFRSPEWIEVNLQEGERLETKRFTMPHRVWTKGILGHVTLTNEAFNGMKPDVIYLELKFRGTNSTYRQDWVQF